MSNDRDFNQQPPEPKEPKQARDYTFEMFKLEYEQAAQRYENIYKAIWQIFQYMALLAGGILTFASKDSRFPSSFIFLIALAPLIFWLWAIYIPMDGYGKSARQHLENIEQSINHKFNPSDFWNISHYTKFYETTNKLSWTVRPVIVSIGVFASVLWFYLVCINFSYITQLISGNISETNGIQTNPVSVVEQKYPSQDIINKLNDISAKINSLELLYKNRK